jgi:predicted transcriptional regulator of viral defense system
MTITDNPALKTVKEVKDNASNIFDCVKFPQVCGPFLNILAQEF